MMQQVNLYHPVLRRQEKIFSATTMLQGALIVLLALIAFYSYAHLQSSAYAKQVQQLETQRNQTIQRNAKLAAEFPEKRPDVAMQRQVMGLRNTLRNKQLVIDTLLDVSHGNDRGFSNLLAGLARQRLSQMWLSRVAVQKGGTELVLHGSALQAEQVPQFIQQLGNEEAFKGLSFQYFTMARPDDDPTRIDFQLATQIPVSTP